MQTEQTTNHTNGTHNKRGYAYYTDLGDCSHAGATCGLPCMYSSMWRTVKRKRSVIGLVFRKEPPWGLSHVK